MMRVSCLDDHCTSIVSDKFFRSHVRCWLELIVDELTDMSLITLLNSIGEATDISLRLHDIISSCRYYPSIFWATTEK